MREKFKSDCDHSCIISYFSEPGMGSIPEGKKNLLHQKMEDWMAGKYSNSNFSMEQGRSW